MKEIIFVLLAIAMLSGCTRIPAEVERKYADECSNPNPSWLFHSCWSTSLGSTNAAILDGGNWDKWHVAYPADSMSVTSTPPPGGPGGNALKIHYSVIPTNPITGNDNWFSLNGDTGQPHAWMKDTNPIHIRIYWYSTWPLGAWYKGNYFGRKFIYLSDQKGVGATFVLGLYPYGNKQMKLVLKNHTFDTEYYNRKDSKHLDGTYAWPGQEDTGIIKPNTWYSIELGIYKHPTQGWVKLWKNGKLVINANKDVRGFRGTYDTSCGGNVSTWLRIPAFRNGGCDVANDEYFSHAVISNSYIGPVESVSDSNAPPAHP